MGRKGFSLVELIATIFIISIVLGIASYSVFGLINSSKKNSEKLFVDSLDKSISQYIGLRGSGLVRDSGVVYTFKKCLKFEGDDTSVCSVYSEDVNAYEMYSGSVGNRVTLNSLILEKFIEDDKIVNPSNKLDCLKYGSNPSIRIFKDSDYVYYYYVDLRGDNTSCEISDSNGVINTLPELLRNQVGL